MPRHWTITELSYLIESAGSVPEREICEHLGRTSRAVEQMAYRLRSVGVCVPSLKFIEYESVTAICPKCGRWYLATVRTWTGLTYNNQHLDFCMICRYRESERRALANSEYWLGFLDAEGRDRVEAWDSRLFSKCDTAPLPPEPPRKAGETSAARARKLDEWRAECERIEAAAAKRKTKAAQKRAQRIHARAVKRFPELSTTKPGDRMPDGWKPSQEAREAS